MNKLYFAQKGIILNKSKDSILSARYLKSKYNGNKLEGKFFLPGGRLEFGEMPDKSFIREINEETGIIIKPYKPIYIWSWSYKKDDDIIQIVAVARLGEENGGTIHSKEINEGETIISKPCWLKLSELKLEEFVEDEQKALEIFISNSYN